MADAHDTKHESETRPTEPKDTGRKDTRRNLNANIAQRQKLLLAGIGGVALLAGAWFILDDDDSASADSESVASIDTGGLVNRNLSQREFVATYGNRLDAQGRAIKDLQDTQLPRPEIEQELDPGEPLNSNLYQLTKRQIRKSGIEFLPATLYHAIDAFDEDELAGEVFGEMRDIYVRQKTTEWERDFYIIHDDQLDRMLTFL